MSFEWERMHKWEDNYEVQIIDDVRDVVKEYYDVEDEYDLTKEQIDDLTTFRDEHEMSIMWVGFNALINNWLEEVGEED